MSLRKITKTCVPLALLLWATVLAGVATTALGGERVEAPSAKLPSGAERYFPDVELVDQFGESHRFYSDLLEGKVVVINAMFTSCAGSCPAMAARLRKLQAWLGDRLGRDVYILSISVDPERDTPESMAAFAGEFDAEKGWYFLTGERQKVSQVLKKLGQYVEQPESHMSVMLIGNEPTGLWKKAMGIAPAEDLIAIVQSVMEDRA